MGRDGGLDRRTAAGVASSAGPEPSFPRVAGEAGPADLSGLSAEQLAVLLRASRQAENLETFRQLRMIEALWRLWLPDEATIRADRRARRTHTSEASLHHATVVTEVAGALRLTEHSAARRLDAALALLVDGRLPLAAATAAQGLLDWPRLNILVGKTHTLTKAQAQAVEERVLVPGGPDLTYGLFERAVDRAVLAVDPQAAEDRRTESTRSRRVTFVRNRNGCGGLDGAASLWATGPAHALLAAFAAVDAAARWLRTQGDLRTLDQLRHDLLVDACTHGHLPVPQDVLPVPPVRPDWAAAARARAGDPAASHDAHATVGSADRERSSQGAAAGTAAYEFPRDDLVEHTMGRRPVVATHVTVLVSEDTLAGRNDEPGELVGYGPITAQMARDLAQQGIWRCAAVDDTHATVTGVGRSTWTPGYVPGKALRDFLAVAALSCTVPWCGTAAEHCDIDHATPYAAGGATCVCNTSALCRRHHREKSAGHLTTEPSTDPAHPLGTTIWATRAGQRFVVLPFSPLPPDAYEAADPDRLAALGDIEEDGDGDDDSEEHALTDVGAGGHRDGRFDPILGFFVPPASAAMSDEPLRDESVDPEHAASGNTTPDDAPPF